MKTSSYMALSQISCNACVYISLPVKLNINIEKFSLQKCGYNVAEVNLVTDKDCLRTEGLFL